ncbi:dihydroneopterin aldolase [Streptococcus suis]|uniref:7,8-dihydroneopterin aldolase n=1 Tax=Streptococcus suis TaxID=1307 RepID=A0A822VLX3_STRSU|nr:dihydroneopterin aldolase [Streptococcus suis]AGZ22945.1 dihydroneopterin aldolase [Streptococcus suis T15]MBS8077958.1 dihydroneopterin aldolase [Streptococcus suis]MCB2883971.1 dihydroneopterin aldolase [Streptococcus suis]MCB2891958.1 dihydroneopterin aldolase [Streptococcus suis]MCB2907972.1 dihydroneopterin aldolase [Streptococcus suis]
MDKISLNKCRFYGYHGAFKEEQVLGQIFTVDCDLFVDLTAASLTDNLEDTIHYGMVFETIKAVVEGKPYILIEKVAGVICQELFDQFPKVEKIRLAIYKENPPIAGHYDSVGIELERERP